MSKYKSGINLTDKNNTSSMIFNKIKEQSLVFDVGCASGYLAEVLVKEKGCRVIGLEIDKDDAKKAERFCELVLTDDIESESWEKKLEGKKFDHIIFADVLEHLKDPKSVLARLKEFLNDEGSILVSVPNVAHVSVRLELLAGKFIPEEVGILDNTHLKYFTQNTFTDLASEAGYQVNSVGSSVFDFPVKSIEDYFKKLDLKPSKKLLNLLQEKNSITYQYFFELKKGKSKQIKKETEKPIFVVKKYLQEVEQYHQKFKKEQKKYTRQLEEENKTLHQKLNSLNTQVDILNKSLFNRVKMKIIRLKK